MTFKSKPPSIMSWAVPLVLFCASTTALSATVKVDLTFSGQSMTPQEQAMIQKASEVAFEHLIKAQVAQCIYRNSYRAEYYQNKNNRFKKVSLTKDKLRKLWSSQVAFLNKFKSFELQIEKKILEDKVLGRGQIAVARVNPDQYKLANLRIILDPEKIALTKKLMPKADPSYDLWVNVIAHEIAHNLGYGHGQGLNWDVDYPGYVPTEVGFCTMTNGKYGSHMGDSKKKFHGAGDKKDEW